MLTEGVMLAAGDLNDWIQIIVVVLVVAGSAIAKVVQTIIARLNERYEEQQRARRASGLGRDGAPGRRMTGDRPVARPMPMTPSNRPSVAPFGEPTRPLPRSAEAPPVAKRSEGLEEAIGEVLSRLGIPQEKAPPRAPTAPPRSTGSRIESQSPRSRRTVVIRSGKAPIARPAASKRGPRPASPTPTPPPARAKSAEAEAVGSRVDSPANAEGHLGQLRSGVEDREVAAERAADHVPTLHPSIGAGSYAAGSTRGGPLISRLGLDDRRSLRRALIVNEVLGAPLSLRSWD